MLPLRKPIAWLAALISVAATAPPSNADTRDDLVTSEVSYSSGTITLHGTVIAPPGASDRRPGVVVVAGAGASDRNDYRPEAEAFARAGVVALIYDKRPGYSRATSTFDDLAADANAGVDLLRTRPEVAPDQVGLWGHSQGGWVVPLAASTSEHAAFIVAVGASSVDAGRTQLWSNATKLAHAGVRESLIGPLGSNASRMLIDAGLFGDSGHDPVPVLRRVRQPVLGLFAEHDTSSVPGESLTGFRKALDEGGNTHYTLRVVRNADHSMRRSDDGYSAAEEFAPGYVELTTTWITALAAGPPTASADAAPVQDRESAPVRPVAWYESPVAHLVVLLVLLGAFAAHPIGGLARRLRGRTSGPGRRPAAALALCGIVAVLGTPVYLFSIVGSGASDVDSAVLGRPPVWLALQLAAIGVVVATAVVWWRMRTGWRFVPLAAAGVLFVPWAAYWGLFTV
ncbi:alpha/beta hydrolase family protein [Umezawaea endophytica]|uniref:Dienelactone hydrolase family protein n=1 Tax=Umezawaea endophytica TaxID=1654476 RepID=A0A9X2VJT1_9PSEU|nr:dienelactone hydrolase family protein [Umezawaea endophytica]MCS7477382.1 dienelactone hydrolase family protein [Umezawaea endophytica]